MKTGAETALPLWRCHKCVQAVKIKRVQDVDGVRNGFWRIHYKDADGMIATFNVSAEYIEKHKPQAGGYYLRNPHTGVEDYSPAEPFEQGYSRVQGEPEPEDRMNATGKPGDVVREAIRQEENKRETLEMDVRLLEERYAELAEKVLALEKAIPGLAQAVETLDIRTGVQAMIRLPIIAMVCLSAAAHAQTVITPENFVDNDYVKIGGPGEVRLAPGFYNNAQLIVRADNVTIIGETGAHFRGRIDIMECDNVKVLAAEPGGFKLEVDMSTSNHYILTLGANDGVEIAGIEFIGSGFRTCAASEGITQGTGPSTGVRIHDNYFHDFTFTAIHAIQGGSDWLIENNWIYNIGPEGQEYCNEDLGYGGEVTHYEHVQLMVDPPNRLDGITFRDNFFWQDTDRGRHVPGNLLVGEPAWLIENVGIGVSLGLNTGNIFFDSNTFVGIKDVMMFHPQPSPAFGTIVFQGNAFDGCGVFQEYLGTDKYFMGGNTFSHATYRPYLSSNAIGSRDNTYDSLDYDISGGATMTDYMGPDAFPEPFDPGEGAIFLTGPLIEREEPFSGALEPPPLPGPTPKPGYPVDPARRIIAAEAEIRAMKRTQLTNALAAADILARIRALETYQAEQERVLEEASP